ncbi:MAG: class I SAM-dependent methyltransferase [Spirochaetales bacterium]|nr:class I SAM-dependent methyltransferase [Spirochaetales bacterium]MCF7939644.1 class I SAM-dependent methyltransferase [Spirochaetales bacterium]
MPCPVCGTKDSSLLLRIPGAVFERCRSCKVVFQNPRSSQEELNQRYGREYFEYELENESQFYRLMQLALHDIGFFPHIDRRESASGEFLDVGCATGMLLESLADRGWSVQGVEVCRESAEYGAQTRGVPIHAGTLESAAFSARRFTVVHASHLIEHLTDPVGFVEELYRIVIPGGYLILTTPNIGGLQARLLGERWRSAIADHIVLFRKYTLKQLVERAGFRTERIKTWGGLAAGAGPRFLKEILDRLVKPVGIGDVMVLLARRPPEEGENEYAGRGFTFRNARRRVRFEAHR